MTEPTPDEADELRIERQRTATGAMRLRPAAQPRRREALEPATEVPTGLEVVIAETGEHLVSDGERWRPTDQTRPGVPADVAGERAAGAIDALETQLAELRDGLEALHSVLEIGPNRLCRECLLPHPCRTVRLARTSPDDPAPREVPTQ